MLIGIEAVLTSYINSDKVLWYKEFRGKNLALINSGMVCSFFFAKYVNTFLYYYERTYLRTNKRTVKHETNK